MKNHGTQSKPTLLVVKNIFIVLQYKKKQLYLYVNILLPFSDKALLKFRLLLQLARNV